MKKKLFVLTMLVFLFVSGTEKDRLAVMDLQDEDKILNKKTISKVTDYIFSRLQETGQYWMIPKSDRDVALEQAIEDTMQGSRKQCVDEKCQLSMTEQLQANYIINTKIKRLYKGTCQITISKFDVEKRAGIDSWSGKFDCSEKGLFIAIDRIDKFGMTKKRGQQASFATGKMGKLEEEWSPDMAGTGEQIIVRFKSEPENATVLIDGKVVGKTPTFKSKMLASGKHLIKMEKDGYYSETKILDLKKGSKVSFNLYPPLSINSNPDGAMIKIDGQLICQSTPCKKVIPEGEREITVQKELYETKTENITIKKGKDINISLSPDYGVLQIISEYKDVDVILDGKETGKTPIPEMKISPGPHRIEPQGECFNTVAEQFVIKKGERHQIKLAVQKKMAAIKVFASDKNGNDMEADVFIDGEKIGTAPGTFKISVCSKEIVVKREEEEFKETLSLKEKKVYTINAVVKSLGLSWSKRSKKKLNWKDAKLYCANLKENGYSDWRLPTISELRTIIKNCPVTETGGSCPITNECLTMDCAYNVNCGCHRSLYGGHSIFGDRGKFWSSSKSDHCDFWMVNLDYARLGCAPGVLQNKVRCSRGVLSSKAKSEKKDEKLNDIENLNESESSQEDISNIDKMSQVDLVQEKINNLKNKRINITKDTIYKVKNVPCSDVGKVKNILKKSIFQIKEIWKEIDSISGVASDKKERRRRQERLNKIKKSWKIFKKRCK